MATEINPSLREGVGLEGLGLERLWPNRTHESNWLKNVCCSMGLHCWHALDVSAGSGTKVRCGFCRWCPIVKVHDGKAGFTK